MSKSETTKLKDDKHLKLIEKLLNKKYEKLQKVYAVKFREPKEGELVGLVIVSKNKKLKSRLLNKLKKYKKAGIPKKYYPKVVYYTSLSNLPKFKSGKISRKKIIKKYRKKLLKKYRVVGKTKKLKFRIIGPEQEKVIKKAVKIHNKHWGKSLKITKSKLTSRARNALLIGAFSKKKGLVGTISAFRLDKKKLSDWSKGNKKQLKWGRLTDEGTLYCHNPQGDAFIFVSISVTTERKSYRDANFHKVIPKKNLTSEKLNNYLSANRDSMISFHRRPKGGQYFGARRRTVIKNARPQAKDSMGYYVLMKYPIIKRKPKFIEDSSIAAHLIESLLIYAHKHGVKHVFAYTRPIDLSKFYKKK